MASRGAMYAKMAAVFVSCCVGGPVLMYYLTPSEGELFKRFSPELQQRNLELRPQRQKDYDEFVSQLKEYSKSDKPIWVAAAEAQEKARSQILERERLERAEREKVRLQMRDEIQGK